MPDRDLKWEAIEPARECSDPSGHRESVIKATDSPIPIIVACAICGERYTVVVLPRDLGGAQ